MNSEKLLKKLQDLKPRFGDMNIKRMAVFGSHARGDAREDSDVDLLIEFDDPVGFFEVARTKRDFESYLGKRVDIVTFLGAERSRHKDILRDRIDV